MRECFEINGKIFFSREEAEKYENEIAEIEDLDKTIRETEKRLADLKAQRYNMTESYSWDAVLTALNKLFDEVIK